MSTVTLRLYDGAGTFVAHMPMAGTVELQGELNGEGSGTLNYPANGANAEQLLALTDGYIGVHIDGSPDEAFGFLVDDDQDDEADERGESRSITIGGTGTLGVLSRGVVLPSGGIGTAPAEWAFTNASPGQIVLDLLNALKALGYLTQVNVTFTATTDSNGAAWSKLIDITYDAGKDLLTVVKDLAAQQTCDVRMRGLTLDLFNPDTILGQDKPATFIRRAHARSAPRKRSRRNLRTDFLVVGDEGRNTLRYDAAARATYGQRIGYVGQGNTTTDATLNRIGDATLAEQARPTRGYEVTLRPERAGCPLPFVDFHLGDKVRTDFTPADGGGYEPMRVRSCALSIADDGTFAASVELNDRFLEAILDLAQRIEGINHGAISANPAAPPPSSLPAPDQTVPAAVASVNIAADTRMQVWRGPVEAFAVVSWPEVTLNDDATLMEDFSRYEVAYRLPDVSANWISVPFTTGLQVEIGGLPQGERFQAQVVAVDATEHRSVAAYSAIITLPLDATVPEKPSAPTLTSRLGVVRVEWDGLDYLGAEQPADFEKAEVHYSLTQGFEPDPTTLFDTYQGRGPGVSVLTDLAYETPVYVRLLAFDYAGNVSLPSDEVSATVQPLVAADLVGKVVAGENIQDASIDRLALADAIIDATAIAPDAVDGTHLGANVVTADHLAAGAVSAESINVGSLSGDLILNGSFEEVGGDGLPTGWTFDAAGSYAGAVYESSSALVDSGVLALKMTPASASGWAGTITTQSSPVSPGDVIYARAKVVGDAAVAATDAVQLVIYWYDSAGALLTETVADKSGLDTSYAGLSGTGECPAGAGAFRIGVRATDQAGGTAVHVDSVLGNKVIVSAQIADGAITAPKIVAGAITAEKLTVASLGENALRNGAFEEIEEAGVHPVGWARYADGDASTELLSGSESISGSHSIEITVPVDGSTSPVSSTGSVGGVWQADAATDLTPVGAGEDYYVSVYADADTNLADALVIDCYWYDSARQSLADPVVTTALDGGQIRTTGGWIGANVQVPVGAHFMRVDAYIGAGAIQSNDDLADAAPLVPGATAQTGNTQFFTSEPDEQYQEDKTAWFVYQPEASGTLDLSLAGSGFDTYLRVWEGPAGATTHSELTVKLVSDDDSAGNLNAAITGLAVDAAKTYYVQVSGYGDLGGPYTLTSTGPANTLEPTAPAPAPAQSVAGYGFSPGGEFPFLSTTDRDAELDKMVAAGATWVRVDVPWGTVQSVDSATFDWSVPDAAISAATAKGLKVLAVLAYTPAWARPANTSDKYGPDTQQRWDWFAAFAGAFAARYSTTDVPAVEVWNEPNITNFWGGAGVAAGNGPDYAEYAGLLKAAYTAIKAQNADMLVVTGGLSPATDSGTYGANGSTIKPNTFVTGLYANGCKGYFDALGHHPYTFPTLPRNLTAGDTWSAWNQTPELRTIMVNNGDGALRIWLTENGAPTGTHAQALSEQGQSDYLYDSMTIPLADWDAWVGPQFLYEACDSGTDPADREQNFGIVLNDRATNKQAFATVSAEAAAWDGRAV